jgi:hypothetical protein
VDYAWIEEKMHAGQLYFLTNNAFSIQSFAAVAFHPIAKTTLTPAGQFHDKAEHIRHVCAQHAIPQNRVMFVDDSLASLQDVRTGTNMPHTHIVQNSWCEKPAVQQFERLSWMEIKQRFEEI